MKKILATVALGMFTASVFAQGTLVFGNAAASLVRTENGSAIPGGGGQVQFAWAPVGTAYTPWTTALTASQWIAANPGWTAITTSGAANSPVTILTAVAGRFSGGTLTAATSTPGAIIQGVVIGWTGTGAADFLAGYTLASEQTAGVASKQFGVSSPFTVDTGDPTTVPAGTAGFIYNSTATPFTGLTLTALPGTVVVPEPSSFALAGLGAAAMLIFRRRK